MLSINIHIPDSVAQYEADIRYFFDSMVRKLATNSHKGWPTKDDLPAMLRGIEAELKECRAAVDNEGQFAVLMEAVDVANMALLASVAVMRMTRQEFDNNKMRDEQ